MCSTNISCWYIYVIRLGLGLELDLGKSIKIILSAVVEVFLKLFCMKGIKLVILIQKLFSYNVNVLLKSFRKRKWKFSKNIFSLFIENVNVSFVFISWKFFSISRNCFGMITEACGGGLKAGWYQQQTEMSKVSRKAV